MKIIRPSFEIVVPRTYERTFSGFHLSLETGAPIHDPVDAWLDDLSLLVERETRISHRSETRTEHGSAQKLLSFLLLKKGDMSVVEHSMLTVEFVVDRGITHELVRHRLFAFTQESTRFINYEKQMPASFIYPDPNVECDECLKGNQVEFTANDWRHHVRDEAHGYYFKTCKYNPEWLSSIASSEENYLRLIRDWHWRPQEARSVFPNALSSKIGVTGNLRNWRHVLLMRTSLETHPQFKQVTGPLLVRLQNSPLGWFFRDISLDEKQSDAMRRLR